MTTTEPTLTDINTIVVADLISRCNAHLAQVRKPKKVAKPAAKKDGK
ncbi:hypothetical protein [Amycolatopsis sp. DSM 110486]|nr:hypothetical protein [Amycolatopsis sp. DSM 110486]QYN17572.1 hypothetical protein K1T34_32830 [Amycolatopsis sp. DSM 110486]